MATLRIGSRGSQLALWQANHVADLLREQGHSVEIKVIKTTGDKVLDVALAKVGTKGMFTKEIEDALAERQIDLAVHSLKDVPTELQPEFTLAAILKREDPHDAFLSVRHSELKDLPINARVGTSSLRRQCQLKALRHDVEVLPLRGNVDTRLRKLQSGEYDAIILAAAGVRRLGLQEHMRSSLSADLMCPAVGQGALAIETRNDDEATRRILTFMDDSDTRTAVRCERALLGELGGGCQVPIGAFAERIGKRMTLRAMVGRPDGSEILREWTEGDDPEQLGRATAQKFLRRGAQDILNDVYGECRGS